MATLFLGSQLMVARGDDRSTPVDAPGPKYERQPSRRIGGGAYIAPERLPISESGHFYCSFPDSRRWRRTGSARVFVKSHSRARAASTCTRRHPGTGLPPWFSTQVPIPVIAARQRLVRAPLLRAAGSHLPPTGRPVPGPPVPSGAAERGTATTNLGTTCS